MSAAPRILFLARYINRGGTSRVTMDLIRFLKKRGNEVALAIASRGPHAVDPHERFPVFEHTFPKSIPGTARMQRVIARVLQKLWFARVLRRFNPQILYCVDLNESVISLNDGFDVPCVAHIHALHLNTMTKGFRYLRRLGSFADHYVASSHAVAEHLKFDLGVPPSKVTVLYNGISVERVKRRAAERNVSRDALGIKEHEIVVMGCGAVSFIKAPDLFLRVAAAVRKYSDGGVPWRFIWVGEKYEGMSPTWDGCRRLASEMHLNDTVQFVGYQGNAPSFFSMANIFLLTSRAESIPLAMMEAMALGKPIVAFPVGGVQEIISMGGGVITKSLDPDEAGKIIAELLKSRSHRERLGTEAARVVRRSFDSENLFGNYEAFLNLFAGGHQAGEIRT